MTAPTLGLTSRPFLNRLGVRLAVLMATVLLPLAIVAYLQTNNLTQEAQRRNEEALMGETLRAASGEIGTIRAAQGLVAGLSQAIPTLISDNDACVSAVRAAAATQKALALVAFVPVSGIMTCSSTGQVFDYSNNPLFQKLIVERVPVFTAVPQGPVTGASLLGALHPVVDAQGAYLGYLSAWLPHDELRVQKDTAESGTDISSVFWTFGRTGELLTASIALDGVQRFLPVHQPLSAFVNETAQVFVARSASGEPRTYAFMPIVEGELYLMSSWDGKTKDFLTGLGINPTLVPLLMWFAGLVMSIWAAELLVLRHIRALNRAIASFAAGKRNLPRLSLAGAPLELQEMGENYSSMTDSIMRDEAALEDTVHQKEVLLREVHHRVKNNLQLIASIMNMQIRQAKSSETKTLLRGLQDRVMSLATIHRGLYQTSGLSDVHADELLSDIVRQIVNIASGPGKQFDLETDFDPIRLTPDQAVPLSLLLTESMTNAMKYSRGSEGNPAKLKIALKRADGDRAVLTVENSVNDRVEPTIPSLNTSTGLGAQLMTAFSHQVGGTLEQGIDGDVYRLRIAFEIFELRSAEHRESAEDESEPGTL